MTYQEEKKLLDEIVRIIKVHAAEGENSKVIKRLDFSWTQVGYGMTLNGYTIEYKDKPKVHAITQQTR